MKKALKIIGITILTIFIILLVAPFIFQSQIKDLIKNYINQNLNAKVEFADVDLSLIQSFPKAHVSVDELVITNYEPFKDETFVTAKSIAFTMSIKELFKKAEEGPMVINSIKLDEALLTLKTDKLGNNNYDITKESETTNTNPEGESSGFAFDIEDYSINNSAVTFIDETSNMEIFITELNHSGKGTFSADVSELDTNTEANVSFSMDSSQYLTNNHLKLDAILGLDLENQKYTFKENKLLINQLPLEFQGYVQILEEGQDIDITFENPGSSFKDFLAVVPEEYAKNLDGVETTGDFKIAGMVKGLMTEETIPTMDISITSNNASFKYPDLPKGINNITINTLIKNETGKTEDTYVDIQTLDFMIDQDRFKSSATLKNITENMLVAANVDGTLNLANLSKAYPIELENELSGILKGKVNANFDMEAIETNAYERIKTSGDLNISNLVFSSEDFSQPIQVENASLVFNPSVVNVTSFKAKTGQSDLNATGTLRNLMGFLFSNNKLQGNFNINSNNFVVTDFLSEDQPQTTSTEEKKTKNTTPTKIPDFLDCTITAKANNVVYDNLNLKNVTGTLTIKDQEATLKDLTSDIFGGQLALIGKVSTKSDVPTFDMNLGASNFDLTQSFNQMELLQSLAPIAKFLQGKLNTTIALKGNLDEELSPALNTLTGSAAAQILTSDVNVESSPLLSKLDDSFSFIDFDKFTNKDIKTDLVFNDGNVNVKPFKLKYQDIEMDISGTHSFDKTMNYNAVVNVPAKYLGSEVNRLIGKINDNQVNNISIPVTANIAGSITNPTISTDLQSGVTDLTKQLIEIEKQKLLNQGQNAIKDLLSGVANGNSNQNNSNTGNQQGTNTTQTDTVSNNNPIQQGVKDLLGGLLSKKKTQKNDSIK